MEIPRTARKNLSDAMMLWLGAVEYEDNNTQYKGMQIHHPIVCSTRPAGYDNSCMTPSIDAASSQTVNGQFRNQICAKQGMGRDRFTRTPTRFSVFVKDIYCGCGDMVPGCALRLKFYSRSKSLIR